MTPTDGLPAGWKVVKEAPTAAEVIAHLDAHGVRTAGELISPFVQVCSEDGRWWNCTLRREVWDVSLVDDVPCPSYRLIAPIARSQVDPAAPSDAAPESQGATGAGGSETPGPVEHADPLPVCPLCGAQPGGCDHIDVHQRGESAKPGSVALRRTVVTITYPWEDA